MNELVTEVSDRNPAVLPINLYSLTDLASALANQSPPLASLAYIKTIKISFYTMELHSIFFQSQFRLLRVAK